MKLFISDLHFFHASMNTSMDLRGFESVEEMNNYMIEKWNAKVKKQDEVFILGDFSFGKAVETMEILRQLKGKKYLILGNHDRFVKSPDFDKSLFEWVGEYKEIHDNGRRIILCHYPVFCYNGQYRLNMKGGPKTYMLYGHVHDTFDERLVDRFIKETREARRPGKEEEAIINCEMINCFCMFSDYTPLGLDEWIRKDKERRDNI